MSPSSLHPRRLAFAFLVALLFLGSPRPSAAQDPPAPDPPLDPLARFEEVLRHTLATPALIEESKPDESEAEEGAEEGAEASEESEPQIDEAAFVWTRVAAIEGLVELYRRRREDSYLERALELSESLLERRDNEARRRDPVRRHALPVWSARSPFPNGYEIDGAAAEAMRTAQPALTAAVVHAGAELVNQIKGERRLAKKYKQRVSSLEKELRKGMDAFAEEFTRAPAGKEGYYHPPGEAHICLSSAELALLGRAHLALAADGRHREDRQRAEQIARLFQSRLRRGPDGVSYVWSPRPTPNGRGGRRERTFHAGWLADFADRAHRVGYVFTEEEVDAFHATFKHIVWAQPPEIPLQIDTIRIDGSTIFTQLDEALTWLCIATRDARYLEAARVAVEELGPEATSLALPSIAALVESVGAKDGRR